MKQQQFIKCPECGNIDLGSWPGGMFYQCSKCKVIQHNFPEPLKALSIRQPWAWLIVNGYKNIENRSTLKNFRGDFLIHASLKSDISVFNQLTDQNIIETKVINDYIGNNNKGGIIGYATITDCVQQSDSPWFVGPNGFVIEKPHPLPFTPCKGALGFFKPKILTK
nr:ASCH domain-containing protein [uncultured Draconibacterium sp.]